MTSQQEQNLLTQAQIFEHQLQTVLFQKESLRMQSAEIDTALEDLKTADDKDIFKISGPILIKVKKAGIQKELEEKKELMGIKEKTLEKSEAKLKRSIEDIKEKLSPHAHVN